MAPAYFVDRSATDSRDGEQVRIAVNGQTGRAAARRIKRMPAFHHNWRIAVAKVNPARLGRFYSSGSTCAKPPKMIPSQG